MADIRVKDLPNNTTPSASQYVATDLSTTQKLTIQALVDIGIPIASQAEAEAGTQATKRMTPLTTKQAIAAQSATTEQVAQIVAIASALSPATTHTFDVVLGQTSVAISGGYQIGKVSEVFLNGVRISGWTATDGDNVAFSAITADDLGGETTAEMVVLVGFPTTGFSALDQRYASSAQSMPSFSNRDVAASQNLTIFPEVEIRRWSATSQLCRTTYQQVVSEPAHPFKFTDAAGNWFSLADREVDPIAVGAAGDWDGSSGTDDGPILSSLFNSGFKAKITRRHAVANTITVSVPCEIEFSVNSGLYWKREVNSVAASLLLIDDNATASQIYGMGTIDGRENVIHATNPVDVFHGSLVRIRADRCRIEGIMVRRSWDNGIGIGATPFSGHPFAVVCDGVRTEYCGLGTHTNPETPGHAGAGIDVASGVGCIISDHVDLFSASAIILDLGAGANCSVSNCEGWYNETAYYFGAPDSQVCNITSRFASGTPQAIWVDQPNIRLSNVMVINCEKNGMLIKGTDCSIDGYTMKNIGYGASNTYTGILIDSGVGSGVGIINLSISRISPIGTSHKSTVKTTGGKTIEVGIQSYVPLTGATSAYDIGNISVHQVAKYDKAV